MNRRFVVRNLLAAGAGSYLSLVFANAGDDRAAEQAEDYTIHSDVRLVLLDVSVRNSQGNFVSNLSRDSFRVVENGRPQEITVFDHNDVPVTVGILVDESQSMTSKRMEVLRAAETLIAESNRQDEIFIIHFNDQVTLGLPSSTRFSDNVQELTEALQRGVPEGKTALNDAILRGLKHLELGKKEKKALVLISDGGDNASEHKRAEMLQLVESSLATIYTIGLFEEDDPDRDPSLLRKLAGISGGEAFFPSTPAQMTPICRRIAKEIRTRYTIGYRPQETNGKKALRHVQVLVSAPAHERVTVRTRSSYRYEEAEK